MFEGIFVMGDLHYKPHKSVSEQVKLLKDRGLIVEDDKRAEEILLRINYYRLSAYSLTLRSNDVFSEKATFTNILQLYEFDEALRNCLIKYTAKVEIAFRTYISYVHSGKYGPLGYMNNRNFEDECHHSDFLSRCKKSLSYSKETFVKHHKIAYNGVYPFWVVVETITFDVLSKLFNNLLNEDKNYISASYYRISREYVGSWLKGSVELRNICAHGGRLYNRSFQTTKVKLGNKEKKEIKPDSPFAKMYGLFMLLPTKLDKRSFIEDLSVLLERYPFVEPRYLGMPVNWKDFLCKYLLPDESEIVETSLLEL